MDARNLSPAAQQKLAELNQTSEKDKAAYLPTALMTPGEGHALATFLAHTINIEIFVTEVVHANIDDPDEATPEPSLILSYPDLLNILLDRDRKERPHAGMRLIDQMILAACRRFISPSFTQPILDRLFTWYQNNPYSNAGETSSVVLDKFMTTLSAQHATYSNYLQTTDTPDPVFCQHQEETFRQVKSYLEVVLPQLLVSNCQLEFSSLAQAAYATVYGTAALQTLLDLCGVIWSPESHALCHAAQRERIVTVLAAARRPQVPLWQLPPELLCHTFFFAAGDRVKPSQEALAPKTEKSPTPRLTQP